MKEDKGGITPNTCRRHESELFHNWPFTANQFVMVTSPLELTISNFIFRPNICYSPYVTSSLTRLWVCRYKCCWSRQRSHSQIRVQRDSWQNFTVSDSRLTQPGGTGPRNVILQEQGGSLIPPGTGFPFRRLLLLSGLRLVIRPRLHTG
jgi:hypothetical protein